MKIIVFCLSLLLVFTIILTGCSGSKSTSVSSGNAGTIQVPDGPKIKVVFNGPPELSMSWEKLGMADQFQVQLIGTLKNVSSQTVTFSEIAFLFDGRQVDFLNPLIGFPTNRVLSPGEEIKIMKGFPGFTESTKVLEVKIKGFQIAGGQALSQPTQSQPTEPAQPAPTPAPTPEPSQTGQTVFTEAPKNPKTPAEVFALFWFLCDKGDYAEAEKLGTADSVMESREVFQSWGQISKGIPLAKVVIVNEEISAGGVFVHVVVSEEFLSGDFNTCTSISKSNLLALMRTGPLLVDSEPYESTDESGRRAIYTREVIRESWAEFKSFSEYPTNVRMGPVHWIKVGEEFTREDTATAKAVLYFSDGHTFETGQCRFVKQNGEWEL